MSLKNWAAVAWMIGMASLPAQGNSIVSPEEHFFLMLNTGSAVTGDVAGDSPAMTSGKCVVFRSTLQNVPKNGTGILPAEWNSSRLADSAGEQTGPLSLPEPGTGTLLSAGLFALIDAAIRKRGSRTAAVSHAPPPTLHP
jgi:hypothetical protein